MAGATAKSKHEARTGRPFAVLLVLLALSVAATAASVVYQFRLTGQDEAYLQTTTTQQVLAERIGARGFEAVNAVADELAARQTFIEFQQVVDKFVTTLNKLRGGDPVEGLPPPPPEVQARVDLVAETWAKATPSVRAIMEVKGVMPGARAYQAEFEALFPQLLDDLDTLVDQLRAARVPASQVNFVLRLSTVVQRMNNQISAIFAGTVPDASAGVALTEQLARFSEGLQALAEGDRALGVTKVPADGPIRETLARLIKLFPPLSEQVDYIASNAAVLGTASVASRELADQVAILQQGLAQQSVAFRQHAQNRFMQPVYSLILGGITLLLIVAAVYLMTARIRQLLRSAREQNRKNQDAILQLLDEMGSLAEGDLGVQATVTEDITGAIADAVNYAVEALRDLVRTINSTAERVAASANDSEGIVRKLITATEHQNDQIGSATSSIQTMVRSIEHVSENAQRSAKVAQHSVKVAAKGSAAVRRTIEGMTTIREQIQETSKRIKRLGESSQEIGNIVELINDIAEQTNILALNAAIQASSAGEAGRGFAVVADEVQRLAERCTSATRQIEALVHAIQADTNEAVGSMEKSTAGVVAGAKRAEDAGNALDEIERVSNQIASLVQSISDAARQQSGRASEVSGNMSAIQKTTEQTEQGTRITGESIGRLAQLSSELRRSVAGFKLPG